MNTLHTSARRARFLGAALGVLMATGVAKGQTAAASAGPASTTASAPQLAASAGGPEAIRPGVLTPRAAASRPRPPGSGPRPAANAPPGRVGASAPAPAQLDAVNVNARRDEVEARRASTAAKIIVDRAQIEQYGDSSMADVLRRLPGVTATGRPGRGRAIAMRGMGGGFTQILIDGERIPPGFSLDDLSPEQVERIEILRAPTAETGARAVAGTINIILREPLQLKGDDVRLALGADVGRAQPHASWTRNDKLPGGGDYTLTAALSGTNRLSESTSVVRGRSLVTGLDDLYQERSSASVEKRTHVHLNARFQWALGGGDQFMLMPFMVLARGGQDSQGSLHQSLGTNPAPYARTQTDNAGHMEIARLNAQLRKRLGENTRLELRAGVGRFALTGDWLTRQWDGGGVQDLEQFTTLAIRDQSWSLNGKLSHTVADAHSLVSGIELEGARRNETRLTTIDGRPSIADFDGNVQASTRRVAAYVQDEWEVSKTISAHAGLRWEGIETRSDTFGAPVSNSSSVLTPLAHAVWRFAAPARDQLRLSLTRSYRNPTLNNLVALPVINPNYPAPGANLPTYSDRAGNPALRPEIARGIDLAIEHYLPKGGVLSANIFRREINDLIRTVTARESVPWATAQRWVSRPQNIGQAVSSGIELDAKARLDELVADQAPVALRANLSVFRSSVEGIPGPDNRIDGQPKGSLNLGADYRLRGLPLMLGASVNYVPAYRVQLSDTQWQTVGMTRVWDAFALWTISPGTRLRVSFSNLVPRRYLTGSGLQIGSQEQTLSTVAPTARTLNLRLEFKL